MTECHISNCHNKATRQLLSEGLGTWFDYCDSCDPLAKTTSERPIPPGSHYVELSDKGIDESDNRTVRL